MRRVSRRAPFRSAAVAALLLSVSFLTAACRSTTASGVIVQRPLLETEQRLLAGVESRAALPAKKTNSMRVLVDGECTLRVGLTNQNTLTPLVFRARLRGGEVEYRRVLDDEKAAAAAPTTAKPHDLLFERVVDPSSGWLDETIVLTGAVDVPIDVDFEIDGTEWHGGHWSQPLLSCLSEAPAVPNVILISLDTLRADRASAYGGNPQLMPALNAFAESAAVFVNAYSQYPQTLGSHATLFTSLYPSEHGALVREADEKAAHRLSPDAETLARVFARNGYATAAFTEDAFVGSSFGFDAGFDVYHDAPAVLRKRYLAYAGAAAKTFENAEAWIQHRPPGPFFLFVHTYEVHTPYTPPRWALQEMQRLTGAGQPEGDSGKHPDERSVAHNTGAQPMTAEEMRWAEQLYDAEVIHLDRELRDFLRRIRELEVYDDTIIAIVSDHGEEFGEHGSMGHGQALHEEHLRVPMMVRVPGRAAGKRFEPFVGLIDLAPTLVELAGLKQGFAHAKGRSLAAWFSSDTPAQGSEEVFSELNASPSVCPAGQRAAGRNCRYDGVAVRDAGHAYIKNGVTGEDHLYSIAEDRREQHDLADDGKAPELGRYRDLAAAFSSKAAANKTPTELDPETQRRLEALGYVDSAAPDKNE